MTGKWEPAIIQSFDGQRYFVHAVDPNIAMPIGARRRHRCVRRHGAARASGQRSQCATAGAAPAALTGNNGKRPEGPRACRGRDGQRHLVAIIGEATKAPRAWKLNAGGQSVLLGTTNNGNGTISKPINGGPEGAGSLSVSPSWIVGGLSPSGTRTQGR